VIRSYLVGIGAGALKTRNSTYHACKKIASKNTTRLILSNFTKTTVRMTTAEYAWSQVLVKKLASS
jgi:hypothetical protein